MRRLPRILVSASLVGLLLAALVAWPAHATLRRPNLSTLTPGGATDGTQSELWFSLWDPVNEVSYSLDLGVTVAMMRATNADQGGLANLLPPGVNASATFQKASDATRDYAFWVITPQDAAWSQFTHAASNLANAQWMVMGADSVGNNNAGNLGFMLTIKQGSEESIRATTNAIFNTLRASFHTMALQLNLRPGYNDQTNVVSADSEAGAAYNGSSFDTKADNPNTYFAKLGDQFSTYGVNTLNPMGSSAWFYDMTRSGSDSLAAMTTNEFDNLAGDGYWGFTAESGNTGRYLLSFVLPRFLSNTEVAAGVTFDNSFARLAGVLSLTAPTADPGEVLGMTEGFLRRLAQRKAAQGDGNNIVTRQSLPFGNQALAVAVVPEPSSLAMLGLGLATLATLAAWRRRRSI
jgi:hypothetical protein